MDGQGIFITFEGPEGGGKTTQIAALVERLKKTGADVVSLREPGGTAIGEQIRQILHDPNNSEITPATEALLYQAARAQLVAQEVIPALEYGKIVILDRFVDSSIVYQGIARELGIDEIQMLGEFATGGLVPDMTILLDIDPEKGLERRAKPGNEWNRMDAESLAFHRRVVQGYRDLAESDTSGRWKIIDAARSADEVFADIWEALANEKQDHAKERK